jgi:hypothetical protein
VSRRRKPNMEPWIYQRTRIRCLGGGGQTWTPGYTTGLGSGVGEEEAKHGLLDIPEVWDQV